MASMAMRVSPACTASPALTATVTTVPGSGATKAPAASWLPGRGKRSISVKAVAPSGPSTQTVGAHLLDVVAARHRGRAGDVGHAEHHGVGGTGQDRHVGALVTVDGHERARPGPVEAVVDVESTLGAA